MPFSNPATYKGHSGIDFPQPRGTLVRASGPGTMGTRNTTPRGGVTAWVDYDGQPGVAYAHLDNYNHTPPRGTRVREGDVIAAVGISGFTTGPHLHSEVYGRATTEGYWSVFDPTRYVGQGGSSGGGSNPFPTPEPESEIKEEETTMLHIRVDDDGNGKAFFALHDTRTNVYKITGYQASHAWATLALGEPAFLTRAQWQEMGADIKSTTGNILYQAVV